MNEIDKHKEYVEIIDTLSKDWVIHSIRIVIVIILAITFVSYYG